MKHYKIEVRVGMVCNVESTYIHKVSVYEVKAPPYGVYAPTHCDLVGEHGKVIGSLIDLYGDKPVVTVLPYHNIKIRLRLVDGNWRLG